MTNRVFVLQATRHQADVSPAAVYGEIQFVLSTGDRTCANPELSMHRLRQAFADFDPMHDYILWAGGDPLSAIVAGMVMIDMKIRQFRYLRFEKNRNTKPGQPVTGFYSPVEVRLEDNNDRRD
jgi:hypothetical protein